MSLCTISNGQARPQPLRPALPAARPVSPQVTQPTKRNTAPPVQKKASSNKSTKPDANSKDKKQGDQSNAESKKPEPEKVNVKNEEELEKLLDAKPNPPKPEDAAEKAKREAAEKAKRQKQITQIKKLKFDRRASTALRIWSTPEKDESEEQKDDPSKAATAETDPNATKPTTEDAKFEQGLLDLQQHVTLGNWDEVKQFLSSLPE